MQAPRRREAIASTHSWPRHYIRVNCQRHAPAALYSRERSADAHCMGCRVGVRAGLDTEVREKILCPSRGSNPCRPVCSQTLHWLSNPSSCGSKRSWTNLRYPDIALDCLWKATKDLSQVSLSLCQDLKPGALEYEAGVLTTRRWRSVTRGEKLLFPLSDY
jgi:hypothetical protein